MLATEGGGSALAPAVLLSGSSPRVFASGAPPGVSSLLCFERFRALIAAFRGWVEGAVFALCVGVSLDEHTSAAYLVVQHSPRTAASQLTGSSRG